MKRNNNQPDHHSRALEKQVSRERDAARLRSGEVSPEELRKENGWASRLQLDRYRVTAIGGQSAS